MRLIFIFKSNVRETWRVILISEADIFLSESLRILAERLSQSEIGLPLRQICYYSPPEKVGVFSTEKKGPRWRDGQHGEPELLASCYRNCLRLASENGCHTVDFPSISTGIYHFPLDQAAQIAVREITAYLADHPEITRVRMVCFDSRTRAAYAAALAAQECAG